MSDDKCPNCNHSPHSGLCGRSDAFTPSGCHCTYYPEIHNLTAREDQPQLGTCDRQDGGSRPHAKAISCQDWRPEDQPRPTPPDPFKASRPDVAAPRKPGCYKNDAGTVIHRGTCSICNLQIPEEYQYDATEAQGEAPQLSARDYYSEWNKVIVNYLLRGSEAMYKFAEDYAKTRVETGAHPSQDAPPVHGPFMSAAADYLREWSDRYKRIGDDAIIDWSGSETQYHLANFAGRMAGGSTPSPQCECEPPKSADDLGYVCPVHDENEGRGVLADSEQGQSGSAADVRQKPPRTLPSPPLSNERSSELSAAPSPDPPPPDVQAVENARDMYFEADKSVRAELARQKTTYCGLLDEAAKEVNSLESTCERLREALRLVLDELHEINLANSHGNKPRNPEMTVFAEVQGLAALAPSLPTKEK